MTKKQFDKKWKATERFRKEMVDFLYEFIESEENCQKLIKNERFVMYGNGFMAGEIISIEDGVIETDDCCEIRIKDMSMSDLESIISEIFQEGE